MNAFVIDAFEFCRLKESRSGQISVADLPRLANESIDRAGKLHWSLQGGSNRQGHSQLALSVAGSIRLMCQRCLTSFDFDIESDSVLVLAQDDGSADEIDALLADETVEVIVGSRTFDISQLIEDEALLTIPLSSKHTICPDQSLSDLKQDAVTVSPFSVLKNLK